MLPSFGLIDVPPWCQEPDNRGTQLLGDWSAGDMTQLVFNSTPPVNSAAWMNIGRVFESLIEELRNEPDTFIALLYSGKTYGMQISYL